MIWNEKAKYNFKQFINFFFSGKWKCQSSHFTAVIVRFLFTPYKASRCFSKGSSSFHSGKSSHSCDLIWRTGLCVICTVICVFVYIDFLTLHIWLSTLIPTYFQHKKYCLYEITYEWLTYFNYINMAVQCTSIGKSFNRVI